MTFQSILDRFYTYNFNQEIRLHSYNGFNSREGLKTTIPISFNRISGVYIFEHKNLGVIYIGSSGKIPKNPKSQGIRSRILQGNTPYKLCDDNIDYHKKNMSVDNKPVFKLSDVTVHIIELVKINQPISIPSVLEHFLIQIFYNSKGKLPYINKVI